MDEVARMGGGPSEPPMPASERDAVRQAVAQVVAAKRGDRVDDDEDDAPQWPTPGNGVSEDASAPRLDRLVPAGRATVPAPLPPDVAAGLDALDESCRQLTLAAEAFAERLADLVATIRADVAGVRARAEQDAAKLAAHDLAARVLTGQVKPENGGTS